MALGTRYQPEANTIVSTCILQNVSIENRENLPPSQEGIDEVKLNYLIEMWNIVPVPLHEPIGNQNYNCRIHFIFFVHLFNMNMLSMYSLCK